MPERISSTPAPEAPRQNVRIEDLFKKMQADARRHPPAPETLESDPDHMSHGGAETDEPPRENS
jgi:hypothetical protein